MSTTVQPTTFSLLGQNLKLDTLNLNDSLLRSRGGALLFHALAKAPDSKLQKLQLQYCELNRTALGALAQALEEGLPALKVLELHGNWAEEEDECVERIKAAMEKRGAAEGLLGLDELEPDAEEEEDEGEDDDEEADTSAAASAKPDDSLDGLTAALTSKLGINDSA